MKTFAAKIKTRFADRAAKDIFALIELEMALVEGEFERQASSNIQVIDYLGDYLRASGGKRVRPALLVLANYASGGKGDDESVIRLATVMEMLHTATLVHDDIIDNAELRRNRASLNTKFGNQTAVLMGDWLYMSAFETSLKKRSLEILDILTSLTRKMTEGEIIQLTVLGNTEITEQQYFDVLRRKTAFLFSACCEIGAILAGASMEKQIALREFGLNLGIAFQLADDVFDFTSDEKTLGKAAGADLLEGKITYPLIKLLEADPDSRGILKTIIDKGAYAENSRNEINERIAAHNVLAAAKVAAGEFGDAARKSLDVLPETEYRSALDEISHFVVNRQK
ncbi:MAG: polyprenyl synthetase family protein [Pyrinomonadaceae bacterium]